MFAQNKKEEAVSFIEKACQMAIFVSIPFVLAIVFFSKPIIRLLFERGAFTEQSTVMTAACLLFYSLGIPFYALREISSKVLGANLQQRKILNNTLLSVVFNIILDFLLIQFFDYRGLAIATSMTGLISFLLMYREVTRMNIHPLGGDTGRETLRVSLIALFCLGVCKLIGWALPGLYADTNIATFLLLTFFFLLYAVLCLAFKSTVMMWLLSLVPEKIEKNKAKSDRTENQ